MAPGNKLLQAYVASVAAHQQFSGFWANKSGDQVVTCTVKISQITNFAYKVLNNTDSAYTDSADKHYVMRNICEVAILFTTVYVKCSYNLLLHVMHCFICK